LWFNKKPFKIKNKTDVIARLCEAIFRCVFSMHGLIDAKLKIVTALPAQAGGMIWLPKFPTRIPTLPSANKLTLFLTAIYLHLNTSLPPYNLLISRI